MAVTEFGSADQGMQTAEMRVRQALSYHDQGARLDALMLVFRITPERERDALFAVMAARLTLMPQARSSAPAQAGAA